MKNYSIATLVVLTFLAIASSKRPSATEHAQSTPSDIPTGTSSNGERTFRGQIAGRYSVIMSLKREASGALTGSYSYINREAALRLEGTVDAKGKLFLKEFDGTKQTGQFKGTWHERDYEPETSIYGDWSKPAGNDEESFYLRETPYELRGSGFAAKQMRESSKKPRYSIEGYYPQLEGPQSGKFNRIVDGIVKDEIEQFKRDGFDFGEVEPGETAVESRINVDFSMRLLTNQLISVELRFDDYHQGAAHGSTSFATINYAFESGKVLELADIFKPDSNYLQRVSEISIAQVRKWNKDSVEDSGINQPYLNDPEFTEGAKPEPDNYRNWTISPNGVVITFNEYQLGSYAAGTQTVTLPYKDLKDIIRPDGPIAGISRN